MKDFDFVLFSPEEIYWLWIMFVQHDYFSRLVLWSIQQFTCHWKWNDPAWVFLCWYRTFWWFFKYWPFDKELRASFPFLQTILNLTLECCQSSDSWILVSLLPDLEVNDLKKSQSNQKSNDDILSISHLNWYNRSCEFLYSAFKDPNQYYDIWVHCMVLAGCMSTFKWVWS